MFGETASLPSWVINDLPLGSSFQISSGRVNPILLVAPSRFNKKKPDHLYIRVFPGQESSSSHSFWTQLIFLFLPYLAFHC